MTYKCIQKRQDKGKARPDATPEENPLRSELEQCTDMNGAEVLATCRPVKEGETQRRRSILALWKGKHHQKVAHHEDDQAESQGELSKGKQPQREVPEDPAPQTPRCGVHVPTDIPTLGTTRAGSHQNPTLGLVEDAIIQIDHLQDKTVKSWQTIDSILKAKTAGMPMVKSQVYALECRDMAETLYEYMSKGLKDMTSTRNQIREAFERDPDLQHHHQILWVSAVQAETKAQNIMRLHKALAADINQTLAAYHMARSTAMMNRETFTQTSLRQIEIAARERRPSQVPQTHSPESQYIARTVVPLTGPATPGFSGQAMTMDVQEGGDQSPDIPLVIEVPSFPLNLPPKKGTVPNISDNIPTSSPNLNHPVCVREKAEENTRQRRPSVLATKKMHIFRTASPPPIIHCRLRRKLYNNYLRSSCEPAESALLC
ncbi:hypothetical protein AbraIFM66950_003294 [Aspergillus brasiliensis]|nr:hypothetical protein AbraIFM66950_003294 [Aspergillus brasiliensis]